MKLKVYEILKLIDTYSSNATLKEILSRVQGERVHKCPKCQGRGYLTERYNAYPSGLPDSDWGQDWRSRNIDCDLCEGEGYTEREYKPKMIQDGWE